MVETMREDNPLEKSFSARTHFSGRAAGAGGKRWDENVFQNGTLREQTVALKNKADAAIANFGELKIVQRGEVLL